MAQRCAKTSIFDCMQAQARPRLVRMTEPQGVLEPWSHLQLRAVLGYLTRSHSIICRAQRGSIGRIRIATEDKWREQPIRRVEVHLAFDRLLSERSAAAGCAGMLVTGASVEGER